MEISKNLSWIVIIVLLSCQDQAETNVSTFQELTERQAESLHDASEFIANTGFHNLRQSTEWNPFHLNYIETVDRFPKHPNLNVYKQRALNMIVLETDFLSENTDIGIIKFYLKELHNLDAAYPKANFLMLERYLQISSPLDPGELAEFSLYARKAFDKGIAAKPKKKLLSNEMESYRSVFEENFEVYLPKLGALAEKIDTGKL